MLLDHDEPTNYEEAMMSPGSAKWLKAMKSEMGSIYENRVWTLVDLRNDRQAIENKWIFKRNVTPLIQSYTNHARKCVRSRSGTHGKISQHNSTNKKMSYKHHNTSQGPRGLEYKCSIIDESAEATISEYRHKLNKLP